MAQAHNKAATAGRVNRSSGNGPLPGFLAPITVPLSAAYGRVIAMRNARYDRGAGVTKFDRPVISVGNITTGGTGKTPMTAWIARLLSEHAIHPVIAMRGYGARPGEMSDEQAEYAELLPDVPVLANPDRVATLTAFLRDKPNVGCVILDDGFQHRRIHRDLDLVLIDAQADTFADRLLPAGHLREPLKNLKRADAVVVTRADVGTDAGAGVRTGAGIGSRAGARVGEDAMAGAVAGACESEISDLRFQIKEHHGKPPVAWCRHVWTRLDVHRRSDLRHSRAIDWLQGQRIVAMLGVGNPAAIRRQIEQLGAKIVANISVADHQRYEPDSLDQLERVMELGDADHAESVGDAKADALFVTHKDWVKLRRVIDWSRWSLPIVVPRLAIDVFDGEPALKEMILAAVRRSG